MYAVGQVENNWEMAHPLTSGADKVQYRGFPVRKQMPWRLWRLKLQ